MAEDDDEDENEANMAEDDEEVDTVNENLDSMAFVSHDLEDHISWIENFNANNEDVEFEDPLLDDIEIEHMLHVSQVNPQQFGNVCVEDVITFHVGDSFDTKELLVQAVSEYSLRKGVVYKAVKNNRKNIKFVCGLHEDVCPDSTIPCNAQCPWKLRAYAGSRSQNKFKITEIGDDHTCSNPTLQKRHKRATTKFVAKFILPTVKTKLDLTPLDVCQLFN